MPCSKSKCHTRCSIITSETKGYRSYKDRSTESTTAASIIYNKLEHLIQLHIVGKCVNYLVSTSLCIIISPSLHFLHVSPLQCNKQGKACENVAVALPVMECCAVTLSWLYSNLLHFFFQLDENTNTTLMSYVPMFALNPPLDLDKNYKTLPATCRKNNCVKWVQLV